MVKIKETNYINEDGSINLETWLCEIAKKHRDGNHVQLIAQACLLSQLSGGEQENFVQQSYLQQGLIMAELLLDLKCDQATIAAAILYNTVVYNELSIEDVAEQLGEDVAKLINGAIKMDAARALFHQELTHSEQQKRNIDNLRKMLLAMVEDFRVVLIKLAEVTYIARSAAKIDERNRKKIAEELQHIYAPLANRLGIGQIKWELEDLALRYLQPEVYKNLAKQLDQKRLDRERYVAKIIDILNTEIANSSINEFQINGRAKHIYSIYRKMQRKEVDYAEIYDVIAVRILVPTVDDCYKALGIVHGLWNHIPQEYDDYIVNPKPNGYRSLHTAVVGPDDRNLEVQIRTQQMHQESELGVAAHWKYKEGTKSQGDYEEKIAWLRQVIEWQTQVAEETEQTTTRELFADRIYVFTPAGKIIDLPNGATPIDFAYMVHSEVGHRCRGAKVNGHIVPLTHQLKTGARVEILTSRNASPSRDWLRDPRYLVTASARAKIHHWFRKQDHDLHLAQGQDALDQEFTRHGASLLYTRANLQKIISKFNVDTIDTLYVGIGTGDIKATRIVNAVQAALTVSEKENELPIKPRPASNPKKGKSDIIVHGLDDVLTYNAGCCKPVPGDPIVGFITKGRGISIHRQDCTNIINNPHRERVIQVSWKTDTESYYPVDITLIASERQSLVKDMIIILANEKVNMTQLTTRTNASENTTLVKVTVEVADNSLLQHLLQRMQQIPGVREVLRNVSHPQGK